MPPSRRLDRAGSARDSVQVRTSTNAAAGPTFSVARFVERVHTLGPGAGSAIHQRLPDGRITLVFRVLDESRGGDVCVAGPRRRALFKKLDGVERAVVLQFKPGWSVPLFGVPAKALTDQIVPLEHIWGCPGGSLFTELLAAPSLADLIERISHAITSREHTYEPASARLARRAVHLLEHGEVRVERVAEQLGVTARHIRRAFSEHIGIGPKEFARTVRLKRAVELSATSNDWVHIAADAGYYDQAHLIAEFRELIGLTPVSFQKRTNPPHIRPDPHRHALEQPGLPRSKRSDERQLDTHAGRIPAG